MSKRGRTLDQVYAEVARRYGPTDLEAAVALCRDRAGRDRVSP
jgi:hypothetical protein